MPIFGTSTASGSRIKVEAARGYGDHDLGRILSECAINDMRVFNAGISRDFQEATALREGTMVKSELQSFQEFSVKDAWTKIKEKLKKLWVKIKGVFRQVYAKLSLWLNRSTKLYVAQNKNALKKKKNLDKAKCPKFMTYKSPKAVELSAQAYKTALDNMVKAIKDIKNSGSSPNSAVMKALDAYKGSGHAVSFNGTSDVEAPSANDLYEALESQYFNDPDSDQTWGSVKASVGGSVDTLCTSLSNSSKYLKAIKTLNRNADSAMKSAIKWAEDQGDKKEDNDGSKSLYAVASKAISNFQAFVTNATTAHIRFIKKGISNERGLIAALVAFNPDDKDALNDSAMMEFAFQAGAAAYFHEADDMSEDEVEAAAEEEGITISIEIENDSDADVEVDDSDAD